MITAQTPLWLALLACTVTFVTGWVVGVELKQSKIDRARAENKARRERAEREARSKDKYSAY